MLSSIYIGLSGMNAYSQGLNVISNNVANLNTPGFKVSDPLFRNVLYRNGAGALTGFAGTQNAGAGVSVDSGRLSFRQGDFSNSGNPLDLAIDGNGFFVIDRNGQQAFTRAGQFEFDKDGFLTDKVTGARVLLNTDTAALTYFNIDEFRVYDPEATGEVSLSGNLSRVGSSTFVLPNIEVFDTAGSKQSLSANFVRDPNNALRWTVEIRNENSEVIGAGEVLFNEDGTLVEDSGFTVTIEPDDLPAFDIAINFGQANTFSGITSLVDNTQSLLQIRDIDGVELGYLTQIEFTDRGELELSYSNGETATPATLVLARFDAPEQLVDVGGGVFIADDGRQPVLSTAVSSGLGRVLGGQIEISNVDLTQQFTNLIIIQRGYQASSQVTSVANELIQQLLALGDG